MSVSIAPSPFGSLSVSVAETGSTLDVSVLSTSNCVLTMELGVPGPAGPAGDDGAPGQGVPAGGTAGQVLAKVDGVDYNTEWVNVSGDYLPLAGGAMDANAVVTYSNGSSDSEIGGWGFGVENTADTTQNASLQYDALRVQHPIYGNITVSSNGIQFPDTSVQTTAWTGGDSSLYRTIENYDFSNVADTKLIGFGMTLTPAVGTTSTYNSYVNADMLYLKSDDSNDGTQPGSRNSFYASNGGIIILNQTWEDNGEGGVITDGGQGFNLTPSSGLYFTNGSGIFASGTVRYQRGQITFANGSTQTIAFPGFAGYAPLASPAFTGNPTAPTPTAGDNDTSIATTAFVTTAVTNGLAGGTAIARNLEVEVRNQTGSTVAAGSIVYISGATGNKPLITLAQANSDTNSAQTIGFVKTAIANNGTGYVIVRGVLENIDTSALTEGVQLYLSPSTAGTWTTTKPYAPDHLVYVGIVIRSHPTQGTILVAVQNGYELDELHNVAAQTPSNNDLLAYEASTDLWKNKTFSALGLLTSATAATTYYPLTGNPSSFLVAADISGKANLSGATFTGLVGTVASTTTTAGLNIPHGTAPTTPVNGDVWTTTTGLFGRVNGTTQQFAQLSGATFTGALVTAAPNGTNAFFNLPQGTSPTVQNNGDFWVTSAGFYGRINGATIQWAGLGTTNSWTGTNNFSGSNMSFGTATGASTINVATGATTNGSTKTVNIGINGVAGSITNISIGSSGGTSTTTLNGTTNGATQAVTEYSTKLATTAFATNADMSPSVYTPSPAQSTSVVSGTGAVSTINGNGFNLSSPPSAIGHAIRYYTSWVRGTSLTSSINWTRPAAFSAKVETHYRFQTVSTARLSLGKGAVTVTAGAPTVRSIGFSFTASAQNTPSALVLEAHDGTTLTTVTSSFTPTFNQIFEVFCYSDGSGNVTLYVNGTSVATTTLGPKTASGVTTNYETLLQAEVVNASAPSALESVFQLQQLKFLVN